MSNLGHGQLQGKQVYPYRHLLPMRHNSFGNVAIEYDTIGYQAIR